jgi:hypothetical protein
VRLPQTLQSAQFECLQAISRSAGSLRQFRRIHLEEIHARYLSTTPVDAVRFYMADGGGTVGNTTSGTIRMYGIAKS